MILIPLFNRNNFFFYHTSYFSYLNFKIKFCFHLYCIHIIMILLLLLLIIKCSKLGKNNFKCT